MKLAVSNIAWKNNEFNKFYELLASLNCSGVEIAPSKIWNNIPDISKENVTSFLSDMKKNKLEFLGFHSLLYGRKDLQLFKIQRPLEKSIRTMKKWIALKATPGR